MTTIVSAQESVRCFNEDEAVWRVFESKRARRRLLRVRIPLSEDALDRLDWLAAERECRTARCVGGGLS